jgi:hypothetical protein
VSHVVAVCSLYLSGTKLARHVVDRVSKNELRLLMTKRRNARPVGIGADLATWDEVTRTFSDDRFPYVVDVKLVLDNGQYVIDAVSIRRKPDGPPITTDGIRAVAWAELAREAVSAELGGLGRVLVRSELESGHYVLRPLGSPPPGVAERGPTDEAILWAARLYVVAYLHGRTPLRDVAEKLGVSRATAARWVRMARDRGLIPENLRQRGDIGPKR